MIYLVNIIKGVQLCCLVKIRHIGKYSYKLKSNISISNIVQHVGKFITVSLTAHHGIIIAFVLLSSSISHAFELGEIKVTQENNNLIAQIPINQFQYDGHSIIDGKISGYHHYINTLEHTIKQDKTGQTKLIINSNTQVKESFSFIVSILYHNQIVAKSFTINPAEKPATPQKAKIPAENRNNAHSKDKAKTYSSDANSLASLVQSDHTLANSITSYWDPPIRQHKSEFLKLLFTHD